MLCTANISKGLDIVDIHDQDQGNEPQHLTRLQAAKIPLPI